MCFSASASFTAAATLAVTGVIAVRNAPNPRWILLALIPALFSLQQACEGVVWVTGGSGSVATLCTYGFLLFAFALWPIWIPISMFCLEDSPYRRAILTGLACVGVGATVALMYTFLVYQPAAVIQGCHVHYALFYTGSLARLVLFLYVCATVGPFLVSSRAGIRPVGVLMFVSCLVALYFYTVYFTSVWCFFAALISCAVVMVIKRQKLKA